MDATSGILVNFEKELADWATKNLEKTGVIFKTSQVIKKITKDEQGRTEAHSSTGEVIPFGMCVWSTGVKQVPLIESLGLEKDRSGRIFTDSNLRVKNRPSVYAMGDCAVDPERPYPCLAQVANQQGAYLANAFNINPNRMDDPASYEQVVERFRYKHGGMMTNIGGAAIIDTRQVGTENVPGNPEQDKSKG